MAVVNQPPILASSFAVNGDKNTIPATNSGTEGLASLSLGFPSITSQPVSQGGIPPQREDFNGIFNLITNFLMFLQNGSVFAYSSTLDYQPPAIVYGNNALYRCVATNGANTSAGVQPLSNTDYWKPLIPVGAITISGNTITVTNETGEQIQYTIDTINNPPVQSDSSNKIVTSAWVKAYAPSKAGSGASGTWGININGNAGTSTKATQDSAGQTINTTYVKGVTASNATLTITKGNGSTSTTTINNVANSAKATQDSDGNVINTTYVKKVNGTADGLTCVDDTFGGQLTVKRNSGYAATIKYTNTNNVNRYVGFTGSDKIMYKWGDDGADQTAFLDASNYNNYAPTKTGGGASGTWGINISGNAGTATKATNAQVLTEKDITNATLANALPVGATWSPILNNGFPCTYGNCLSIRGKGATQLAIEWSGSDATMARMFFRNARDLSLDKWSAWREVAYTTGNIASATKATQDKKGRDITGYLYKTEDLSLNSNTSIVSDGNITEILNSFCTKFKNIQGTPTYTENPPTSIKSLNDKFANYLPLSGGNVNGNIYTTDFLRIKNGGNSSTEGCGIVINNSSNTVSFRDWKLGSDIITYRTGNTYAETNTPPTNDNSTRIATTAFVNNLLDRAVGKTQPTLTALINWDSMKSYNGGTDVRNIKNTTYGVTAYGGDTGSLNDGDIILKSAFNNYDAILVEYTNDAGEYHDYKFLPTWVMNKKFNTKGCFDLVGQSGLNWIIRGSSCPTRPSTTTRFNSWDQNCGIIEIYGVTY